MPSELITQENNTIIQSRSWLWLNICLIVLILLLVGAAVGFYYAKHREITQIVNELSLKTESAQRSYSETNAKLSTVQQQVNQQALDLHQQQQALQQLTLFTQQKQWRLEEIGYLLNLADNSLRLGYDIPMSQSLLEQVCAIIHDINDPSLEKLSQAVHSDIHVLANIDVQTSTSILLDISALEQQVDAMPLLGSSFVTGEADSPEDISVVELGWRFHLKNAWHHMKDFIVVRKTPNSLLPLIAQTQGEYINQYIHMQLSQAQWAALHHENNIYQTSLEQVDLWINRYYVALNPATQDVLHAVAILREKSVAVPRLSLIKTLDEYNKLMRA